MKIKCNCCMCNKSIIVSIPKKIYMNNINILNTITCNECIPENSTARDGINESIFTEVKRKENANDKMVKWLKYL